MRYDHRCPGSLSFITIYWSFIVCPRTQNISSHSFTPLSTTLYLIMFNFLFARRLRLCMKVINWAMAGIKRSCVMMWMEWWIQYFRLFTNDYDGKFIVWCIIWYHMWSRRFWCCFSWDIFIFVILTFDVKMSR